MNGCDCANKALLIKVCHLAPRPSGCNLPAPSLTSRLSSERLSGRQQPGAHVGTEQEERGLLRTATRLGVGAPGHQRGTVPCVWALPFGGTQEDSPPRAVAGVESSLRVTRCREILRGLPDHNYAVLSYLMGFLHEVSTGQGCW